MIIETQNNHSWEVGGNGAWHKLTFLANKKSWIQCSREFFKKIILQWSRVLHIAFKTLVSKVKCNCTLLLKHSSPKAMYFTEATAMEFCTERIYFGMWTFRWFKDMMWIHIIFSWRWALYLPLCYEIIPLNSSTATKSAISLKMCLENRVYDSFLSEGCSSRSALHCMQWNYSRFMPV